MAAGRTSAVLELGRASVLTRGGPLPPSIAAWPLRVYAEFHGRALRFTRFRPVRVTDNSMHENDPLELGVDPPWAGGDIPALHALRRG